MSKISAYATSDTDAIAVSKKITYRDLSRRLSCDFDVSAVKGDIQYISNYVSCMSNDVSATF